MLFIMPVTLSQHCNVERERVTFVCVANLHAYSPTSYILKE